MAAVIGVVLSLTFKDWTASGAGAALKMVIHESKLPQREKDALDQIVRELVQEFKQDRLSLEDLESIGRIFLDKGPVYTLAATYQFDAKYLEPSGLDAKEKEAARLAINRLMQGLLSGVIGTATVAELSAILKTIDNNGDEVIKKPGQVTDEEIRIFIRQVEQSVTAAGVPHKFQQIDLAAEMRRTIAAAIGRNL